MSWEGSGVSREGSGVSREGSRVSRGGSGVSWVGSGMSRGALAARVPPPPHGTEGRHPRPPMAAGHGCDELRGLSRRWLLGLQPPPAPSPRPPATAGRGTVPRVLPVNRAGGRGVWHGQGLLTRWAPRGAPCLASGRCGFKSSALFSPFPEWHHQPARTNSSPPGSGVPAPRLGSACPPSCGTEEPDGVPLRWALRTAGVPALCARHTPPSPWGPRGGQWGHLRDTAPRAWPLCLQRGGSVETQPISRRWCGMAPRAEVPQHPHRAARHESPAVPRHAQV